MTLNKAFQDIYCKFLTEQGYQWCSKLQRFVKVVNQELIYFIGLKKVPAWLKGNKGFTITAGIMSVYFLNVLIGHMAAPRTNSLNGRLIIPDFNFKCSHRPMNMEWGLSTMNKTWLR